LQIFLFVLVAGSFAAGCSKKNVVNPGADADKPRASSDSPSWIVVQPSPPSYDYEDPPPEPWTLSPAAPVPKATSTTGACIPALVDGSPFWEPVASGNTVELCRVDDYEALKATCYTLDVDSGVLSVKPPSKAFLARLSGGYQRARGPVKRADDGSSAQSCVGACVPLDLCGMKAGNVGVVGPFAFVGPGFDGDWGRDPLNHQLASPMVRVFDATTGALRTLIDLEAFESECPEVFGTGAVVYVEVGVCAGPGASGYFFDPGTGAFLGTLGGAVNSASAWSVRPVALGSGRFAFRDQYGMAIYTHSGADGTLVSRLNLTGALNPPADEWGFAASPEEGGMAQLADGRLVVTNGERQRDRVTVVDKDAAKIVKVIALQPCP